MLQLNSDDLNLNLPDGLVAILQKLEALNADVAEPPILDAVRSVIPPLIIFGAQMLLAALSVALPPCNLNAPPADVFITIDSVTRNYRFECKHASPHCWDLSGKYTGC